MNLKEHTYIQTIKSTSRPWGTRGNRGDSALNNHKHIHIPRNYDPNTLTHHKTRETTANPQTYIDPNYQLGWNLHQIGGILVRDLTYP
jgi:hypothetical protein